MNADLTDEQAEILAKEIDMNAKKEEREAFEAWRKHTGGEAANELRRMAEGEKE